MVQLLLRLGHQQWLLLLMLLLVLQLLVGLLQLVLWGAVVGVWALQDK